MCKLIKKRRGQNLRFHLYIRFRLIVVFFFCQDWIKNYCSSCLLDLAIALKPGNS